MRKINVLVEIKVPSSLDADAVMALAESDILVSGFELDTDYEWGHILI